MEFFETLVGHIPEKVPFDLFVYRRIIILELDSEKRKKNSIFINENQVFRLHLFSHATVSDSKIRLRRLSVQTTFLFILLLRSRKCVYKD